jgi:uncharacterized protein YggE
MSQTDDVHEQPSPPSRRVRPVTIAVVTAVALGAGALSVALTDSASATSAQPSCAGSAARLTVQGSGRSTGSPDVLDFQAQVTVDAASAAAALSQDNETTTAVVAAVEFAGVRAKDISTTNLTVNPTYSYSDGSSVITGYEVSNSIAVSVRKLATAGSVIDAVSSAGGNALSIGSLNFTQTDPRRLEDRARQDAVRQAVAHAAAMARASGERLASVCSITDQSTVYPVYMSPLSAGVANGAAHSVPLQGGTQEVTAQVTLVYALASLGG